MKNLVNYQKILKSLAPSQLSLDLRNVERLLKMSKNGDFSNNEIIADTNTQYGMAYCFGNSESFLIQ